jgi:outer membrane cobalamin receptor
VKYILVIEKAILFKPGINIAVRKRFELPFAPYEGLRIKEGGAIYIVGKMVSYHIEDNVFCDTQIENMFDRNYNLSYFKDLLIKEWDFVEISEY